MANVQAFSLKFKQAIDYLKTKEPAATLAWDDLAGTVHAKVFAVAGATKADLVNDLHKAVIKNIDEGRSISQFRKDFDKAVQQHGWTYKGKRGWRSRIIYNTNMRSAHMAGRWAQIQSVKDKRPYLQYRTAGDERVRQQHRAWDGLVYHVDHDFWDTHYPPNGWNCRCTVRSYSSDDINNLDLTPQDTTPESQSRVIATPDGEITDIVPLGVDAGWDHNVGKSWIAPEVALGKKLARLPTWLRGTFSQKTVTPQFQKVIGNTYRAFRDTVNTSNKPRGNIQILGYLDQPTIDALQEHVPDLLIESTLIAAVDSQTRHLEQIHKATSKQYWPRDWFDKVPELLTDYRMVLWDTKLGDNALIVIPKEQYNDTLVRIVLRPNAKTKQGKIWSVRSYGSVEPRNLKERIEIDGVWQNRYKVLLEKE